MKILVTGANGYLGRGIVEAILNHKQFSGKLIATGYSTENVDNRAKKN